MDGRVQWQNRVVEQNDFATEFETEPHGVPASMDTSAIIIAYLTRAV